MRLRTLIVFSAGYACGVWTGRDRLVGFADRARSFLDSDLVRDYVERVQTETEKARQGADSLAEPDGAGDPEEVDEFDDAGDFDDADDFDEAHDEDAEDEEAAEPAAADQEPERARSARAVRRRAPGRARR